MEQVDDMNRNIGIFLEDEMRRKGHFCSTGFKSNAWDVFGQIKSNLSKYVEDVSRFPLTFTRRRQSAYCNSKHANEISQQRMSTLSGILEALTDNNIIIIGVYGTEKADILEKVSRRVNRDNLFDMVVMASVTKKPDLKRIQGQVANAFSLTMEDKNIKERAGRLRDRIKMEQKILIILQDLCNKLDLENLGIPFGANHTGCKILLTSTSEEILSKQMHAQKVFMA